MTYNVFGGMLNLTRLTSWKDMVTNVEVHCTGSVIRYGCATSTAHHGKHYSGRFHITSHHGDSASAA